MSKKRGTSKKRGATRTSRRRTTSGRAAKGTPRGAVSVMMSAKKSVRERTAAVAALPPSTTDDQQLASLMKVLCDQAAPITVRFAALQSLGAARFSSSAFPSNQGDYIAALRKVADDPDPELRQRVLGILAREKDGYAEQRLLDGLRHPENALLPPEKALQLLGYNVHAEAYPIAREIVQNPPNPMAKREALRLLAADAASAPTFEAILRDKNETPEIRQLGAAALHAIRPDRLQAHAREILLDPSEHDDIRQTSLTALTQFSPSAIADDKPLMDRIDQLSTSGSVELRESASRFRSKYRA